jgi:aryl-alcohol dehydrogenase-like predicted oxidoreductase
MQMRPLGRTGLTVPAVGMGTWRTFDVGTPAAEANCRAVLDAAYAAGATLFDTSPMYGESEEVLARAMGDRRRQAIVADKVWTSDDHEAAAQIRRALRWYGGRVEIYQVHNLVALDTRIATLERLREDGSVLVIGATHYQHSAFPALIRLMKARRVGMVQVPYNALDRIAERELLPAAAEHGVGVMVMRPLGEGRLARLPVTAAQLAPLAPFGITTWAQALLAWILADDRVSCVIPATSKPERMRENALAGSAAKLDDAARAYVGEIVKRG